MSLAACAALIERGDPDRFAAVMAAPVAARARLWSLYAFNLEVARIPWVTQEPMIAEMRLQFWRDVVAGALTGAGVLPAHEVAGPLVALIRDAGLPVDVLDRLIVARRWDIGRAAFADEGALDAYLADSGGSLVWLAAKALGAPDGAEDAVRLAGWAMALAGFLRAVPELEARGRAPLPDGRPQAVARLAAEGLARLRRARALRHTVPRSAAPALWAGWQTAGLLQLAARAPQRVAEGRLQLSEFARRGGLLWVAASERW